MKNPLRVLIKVSVIARLSHGVILRSNKINLSSFSFRFHYFRDPYDQILYSKTHNELFFSACYHFNENRKPLFAALKAAIEPNISFNNLCQLTCV